ncbi:MAG TPA: gamma-glutamylcyclotransferase family protein [Ilumatobacter sp.]|nr:gamma-glutamylcyclotransferase family protein [Ilumatobacter sp.]
MTDEGNVAHLFVYGTLLPDAESWPVLQPYVVGDGRPDWALGTLFDTGLGYPAATFAATATARIAGRVFELPVERRADALVVLDDFEDIGSGLYRRVVVTTGCGVVAWAYEAGTGFDLSPIESGDWLNRN